MGSTMPPADFPVWTLLSFPALVLAIAVFPMVIPHLWEKRSVQIGVILLCTLPVVAYELAFGRAEQVLEGSKGYLAFVITLGALFTTSGGIHLKGDIEATPRNNVLFLPLGDPPLLVGYIMGVPFFWTLHLFPIWLLYVVSFLIAFYVIDKRAYARETRKALAADRAEIEPLSLLGRRNILFLLAIVPAALLPEGFRELCLLAIALLSFFTTPKSVHDAQSFSFGPIIEVAIIFCGLFLCLGPIEVKLAEAAPHFPVQEAWQLFWGSGVLSSVLDNAPTYTAFAALARGLAHHSTALVAGIDPIKLAAISAGSVVMGATTYIGNGPNLMVKAVAERERYAMPSFGRYFVFAFTAMLPAHLIVTLALWWLDR